MPKRITYLTKREDLVGERFREHWSGAHAAIAVGLPGIVSYRQNHIETEGVSTYGFDGIVELWFGDEGVVSAGLDSDVADRLIEDEPNFLSGLVGGAVRSEGPTPRWTAKLWVLARWAGGERVDDAQLWLKSTAQALRASGGAFNVTDPAGPQLTRLALDAHPRPPQVAMTFGFPSVELARHATRRLNAALGSLDGVCDVDVLLAHELVVV